MEPIITPRTKYFCTNGYIIRTGTLATTMSENLSSSRRPWRASSSITSPVSSRSMSLAIRSRLALLNTGFVALTCAVGLFAAATPAQAQERGSQAVPAEGGLRRLTLEQLRDGRYRLPLRGDEEVPIRFHEGQGAVKYDEGATQQVRAGLAGDLVAFGDLNGDPATDAAVVVFVDPGGSGTFIHLLAILDYQGTPVQAARVFLGDRVRVQRLAIWRGRILLTVLAHGPDDGLCCPSTEIIRAFTYRTTGRQALHGGRLEPSQLLVLESPLPGESVAAGIELQGRTSTQPSGDGLAYLVYDAGGGVIGMGRIPVAADPGSPGAFVAPVSFLAGAGGPGRIEVVDMRQHDGSALARASVQVLLEAADSVRRPGPHQPAPRQIVIETPATGAAVGASVELRGWISTVPFENNLTYRVYSDGGAVIDRGWIMVEGDLGERGTFARSITLPSTHTVGTVRIEVRDVSEADGSLFASTTVQVFLTGAGSSMHRE